MAGFNHLLAWLLGWKASAWLFRAATGRVDAAGAIEAEVYNSGSTAGQVHG